MPAYIIRWPDGAVSITVAATKREALAQLKEIGNPDPTRVYRLNICNLHFTPTNDEQRYRLALVSPEASIPFLCPNDEERAPATPLPQQRKRVSLHLLPTSARSRTKP